MVVLMSELELTTGLGIFPRGLLAEELYLEEVLSYLRLVNSKSLAFVYLVMFLFFSLILFFVF